MERNSVELRTGCKKKRKYGGWAGEGSRRDRCGDESWIGRISSHMWQHNWGRKGSNQPSGGKDETCGRYFPYFHIKTHRSEDAPVCWLVTCAAHFVISSDFPGMMMSVTPLWSSRRKDLIGSVVCSISTAADRCRAPRRGNKTGTLW